MPPRRPQVTLDQLTTFLAVADSEHVGEAAAALHRSPAAVSEQLRQLERSLGVALLERHGRGIRLAHGGRELRSAALVALDAALAVEDTAAQLRGLERGRIVLSVGNVMGSHRLPDWLRRFMEAHPAIEVEVRLDNMRDALGGVRAGDIDCAIVGGDVHDAALDVLALERHELVVVVAAGHPLALSRQPRRALRHHPYLARGEGSGTERLARRVLGAAYATGPVLRLGQGAVQAGLLGGLGWAVMPRVVVDEHIAAGSLVVLDVGLRRAVHQDFHAVRRRTANSPALAAFWEHLRRLTTGTHAPG